jgi:16S rRNA (cytosine967-C5)-methyltransferase
MVKPGGRMVYATCSMLPEENERQIEKFLAVHPDFSAAKTMRLTPARDDTDGFFIAVLTKREKKA